VFTHTLSHTHTYTHTLSHTHVHTHSLGVRAVNALKFSNEMMSFPSASCFEDSWIVRSKESKVIMSCISSKEMMSSMNVSAVKGCCHCHQHPVWNIHGYGVATISRLLKIVGLFCRISSLLQVSFAKETCNFKEPTNYSHPIVRSKEMVSSINESVIMNCRHISVVKRWCHQ